MASSLRSMLIIENYRFTTRAIDLGAHTSLAIAPSLPTWRQPPQRENRNIEISGKSSIFESILYHTLVCLYVVPCCSSAAFVLSEAYIY